MTEVPWHLDRTSCTKVIPYLAFACELDVSTMMFVTVEEWNDLGLKCHPAMLPNLGIFAKIFTKKLFMVPSSFIGFSMSLMCNLLPGLASTLPY